MPISRHSREMVVVGGLEPPKPEDMCSTDTWNCRYPTRPNFMAERARVELAHALAGVNRLAGDLACRCRPLRNMAMGGRLELHCGVVPQSTVFKTVCRPFSGTHRNCFGSALQNHRPKTSAAGPPLAEPNLSKKLWYPRRDSNSSLTGS